MRILILSDTHGHLELINTLVDKHKADAVVHCGDFGLESATRLNNTPQRELTLRIRHAPPSVPLPHNARKNCFKMNKDEKISFIEKYNLLGEFDAFIKQEKKFHVPVYCVWGNHEDNEVVRQLVEKKLVVPNLHMVTGPEGVLLDGWIRLVGVGGNIIHWLLFDNANPQKVELPSHPELSVPRMEPFYPSMRFAEWVQLLERFKVTNPPKHSTPILRHDAHYSENAGTDTPKEHLWLATHVSPGKEPTLEWLMWLLGPSFVFSGHMGPPLPDHYSMFSVMDDLEWLERVNKDLIFTRSVWEERKWTFDLWYFALDLVSQPDVETSDPSFKSKWVGFEEATFERLPGTRTSLINLCIAEFDLFIPMHTFTHVDMDPSAQQGIKNATSSKDVGDQIIRLFVYQPPQEDSVSLPTSKKGKPTTQPFPNPRIIPTREEVTWLEKKVREFLVVPQDIIPKERDGGNGSDGYIRKASDVVKRSPQFFNLPDAYMGGYLVVDTNAAAQTLTFMTIGTYPQSHIV